MNSINFTANLVKRTQIQKTKDFKTYNPTEASIVELDKYDERDLNSLYKTVVLWNDQNAKYSSSIYHEAIKGYEYDDVEQEHYFALTTQKDNFKELDPNKILGLMLFSQTNAKEDEINWLQVRPNTSVKQTWKREFSGAGKGLVTFLKDTKLGKPIHVQADINAVEFYKKMGFTNRENDGNCSLYLEI